MMRICGEPNSAVDLRVGGGAAPASRCASRRAGRSPRGRRSRAVDDQIAAAEGSISAWAEGLAEPARRRRSRVDLRVGGGADGSASSSPATWVDLRVGGGLTMPRRMRSAIGSISAWAEEPPTIIIGDVMTGSISAWAEEPCPAHRAQVESGVDLRVGGEPATIVSARRQLRVDLRVGGPSCLTSPASGRVDLRVGGGARRAPGLEPGRVDLRVGGGATRSCRRRSFTGSISAWAEGRAGRLLDCRPQGSISAWAEEPQQELQAGGRDRVDLRVGGGAVSSLDRFRARKGRSPRGRRSRPASGRSGRRRGRSPRGRRSPIDTRLSRLFQGRSPRGRRPNERVSLRFRLRVDLRVGGGPPTWMVV